MKKMKAACLMLGLVIFLSAAAVSPSFNFYFTRFGPGVSGGPNIGLPIGTRPNATVGDCCGLAEYFNLLVRAGAFNLAAF